MITIIAVDHKYIPENAAMGDVPGDRPDVQTIYCEVMQMGACKLDDAGNEIAILNLTVAAHQIKIIPPWLSQMTGMTSHKRERHGIPFSDALQQLYEFTEERCTPWTFNGDWWVIQGNAAAQNVLLPFKQPFYRAKPKLNDWGITLADYQRHGFSEMNSVNLHRVLGIELPTVVGVGPHDAVHDARSLAYSLYALLNSK